jgi:hypothetical protein
MVFAEVLIGMKNRYPMTITSHIKYIRTVALRKFSFLQNNQLICCFLGNSRKEKLFYAHIAKSRFNMMLTNIQLFTLFFYVISCLESTILFDILIPPIRA